MFPYSIPRKQCYTAASGPCVPALSGLWLFWGLWLCLPGLISGQSAPSAGLRQLLEHPQDEAFFQQLVAINPLQFQEDTTMAGAIARKAMAVAQREGRQDFLAIAYVIAAKVAFVHSDWVQTLNNALSGRQLAAEQHLPQVEAMALASLGAVYQALGEPDSSLAMSRQCIRLYTQLGDSMALPRVWNNIGVVYANQNRLDSALYYYTRANAALIRYTGVEAPQLINNIGEILMKQQQYPAALAALRKALALKKNQGNRIQFTKTLRNIGFCHFKTGATDSAISYYLEAQQVALAFSQFHEYTDILALLADAYARQGKYDRAFQASQKALNLADSLRRLGQAEAMARAEVKFHMAFKDRENRLLRNELLQEQAYRQNQRNLLALSAVIVALLTVLVYVFWRLSRERHQHLARISALNASLEQRVGERTRDLSRRNAQLEAYADLNSHSLRSKLATLLGLLTLIDMEEQTEAGQRYTAMVRKTAEELDLIVHEINALVNQE